MDNTNELLKVPNALDDELQQRKQKRIHFKKQLISKTKSLDKEDSIVYDVLNNMISEDIIQLLNVIAYHLYCLFTFNLKKIIKELDQEGFDYFSFEQCNEKFILAELQNRTLLSNIKKALGNKIQREHVLFVYLSIKLKLKEAAQLYKYEFLIMDDKITYFW